VRKIFVLFAANLRGKSSIAKPFILTTDCNVFSEEPEDTGAQVFGLILEGHIPEICEGNTQWTKVRSLNSLSPNGLGVKVSRKLAPRFG